MDGVINVLKPPGMTSSDVVVYLRRLLKVKKVGHTGTLDPGAAGVLPVCIGKATRLASLIIDEDKVYRCEMILGVETDTLDSYGRVISTSNDYPTFEDIKRVFEEFRGRVKQSPPMHSAIKYKGKKLYEYARQGQELDISGLGREVTIYRNTILQYLPPNKVLFEVECSKGTYIRSLCRDIGRRLGCGAYMGFLLRCRTGRYTIDDSYTLYEIEEHLLKGELDKVIISMDKAVEGFERVDVPSMHYQKLINGNPVKLAARALKLEKLDHQAPIRVYCRGQFIGIGMVKLEEDYIHIKMDKVLV
ncbi:tRNA pseudouridine(55) synthase TruB [Caldicoprobacter faecalis]|uniref:tRNA pseudouridine synthase B n=1 Tax=Caldicoprobacter faecalis TaxID=937334 RepID=A0A1I5RSR5_9FIRM|nr:tRNA pseudouridine(55) synthase TruB [Caldicoprobacter faecalis]SFP60996.1 tRNA pseudouridine synthase B [Caldicoprobacter faecalis]